MKLPSISGLITDGISALANSADKIIDDFGYKLKEKVALFITRLYQRL